MVESFLRQRDGELAEGERVEAGKLVRRLKHPLDHSDEAQANVVTVGISEKEEESQNIWKVRWTGPGD